MAKRRDGCSIANCSGMGLTARSTENCAWIARRWGLGPPLQCRRACRACSTVARRSIAVCSARHRRRSWRHHGSGGSQPRNTMGLCAGGDIDLGAHRSKSASASPKHEPLPANPMLASLGFRRLSAHARSIRNPARMHRRLLKKLRRRGRSSVCRKHLRSKPLECWFQDTSAGWPAGHAHPYLGSSVEHCPPCPARHPLYLEDFRRRLPGTG